MKTISVYQEAPGESFDPSVIQSLADDERCGLRPPAPTMPESRGFVALYDAGPKLMHIEGFTVYQLAIEKRVLPAPVVNKALKAHIEHHMQTTGLKPGSKKRAELKERTVLELLPKAFTIIKPTMVIVDRKGRRLFVEGGEKAAEDWLEWMRNMDISLPLVPWASTRPDERPSLAAALTTALETGEIGSKPNDLLIGRNAEIKNETDKVRFTDHDLGADEVRAQIRAGFYATCLQMMIPDVSEFMLDQGGGIKAFRPFVGTDSKDGSGAGPDPSEAYSADALLLADAIAVSVDRIQAAI